jgi:glycosyltransferase involved in cell wall biosynthesis
MIDVIIPARNEAETIAEIVSVFVAHPAISSVIVVVDADTTDGTGDRAMGRGALAVYGSVGDVRGKGQCVRRGLDYVDSSQTILCDADMVGLTSDHVTRLASGRFVIGVPDLPLTEILANPIVQERPEWFQAIISTWDMVSGERSVPTKILRELDLRGYLMETQINVACLRKGLQPEYKLLPGLYSPFVMSEKRLAELNRDREWALAHGLFGNF